MGLLSSKSSELENQEWDNVERQIQLKQTLRHGQHVLERVPGLGQTNVAP